MSWQIAIIFNLVFSSIRSYLDKKLVGRLDPFVLYLYTFIWSGIFFTGVYFLRYGFSLTVYPEMLLFGPVSVMVIGSYLMAIRISLSQTVVFGSYYLIIPMVLSAIFLGEWQLFDPSTGSGLKNISGVILALISLYFLLKTSSKKEEKLEKRWLLFTLIYIIGNGFTTFWSKTFLASHGSLETLVSQTIGGAPIMLIIILLGKKQLKIAKTDSFLTAIDGLAIFLAVVFYYQTLKNGPATIVLPVMTLVSTIIVTMIGLIFYKEVQMFKREKLLGLILGIVGVGMLVI